MAVKATLPSSSIRASSIAAASDPPRLDRLSRLLAPADVRALPANSGQARPWDVRVFDERLGRRVLLDGAMGLGDAYVDGWWECDDLPELFGRVLRQDVAGSLIDRHQWASLAWQKLRNLQTPSAAYANGQDHYDRGNALFASMLDARMTYTCGYWCDLDTGRPLASPGDLDAAQEAKLELVCRKIGVRPGDRVLDIGCGWGSFAKYAAERHGASVVGVTVSKEQIALGRERCAGLPVELRLQDYRELPSAGERFDHVVSLGMYEHVGPKNAGDYMRVVEKVLRPDGLFLLHTIATRRSQPDARDAEMAWIVRHIFPGGSIPSMAQIGRAVDGRFVVEDLHNFGVHYERTLLAWFDRFDRNWPDLRGRYGAGAGRFYRLWKYYLLTCAGVFRSRKYGLWQVVLSPKGVPGGWSRPDC